MINKIGRVNVSEAVTEEVKRLIHSREWPPGSKIPSENELAAMMGVSRVSVRNALQRLAGVGLIESRQGEGTFVSQLDGGQAMNMLMPMAMLSNDNQKYMVEFRRVIESEQAYLAALRVTEEELAGMYENYEAMKQVDPMSDLCSALDVEFHMLVAKASKNPMFIQTSLILKDTILNNVLYVKRYTKENEGFKYHLEIIEALERHDAAAARSIMYEHLERLWSLIQEE